MDGSGQRVQGVARTLACLDIEKKTSYPISPTLESHFEDCSSEESDSNCMDSDSDEASCESKSSSVFNPPPGQSVSYLALLFCLLYVGLNSH